MSAGQIGAFVGLFLAAAGVGYIFLGVLWVSRAYKLWPRASTWSAIALTAVLGFNTAVSASELALYGSATSLACAFMVFRARRALFPDNVA